MSSDRASSRSQHAGYVQQCICFKIWQVVQGYQLTMASSGPSWWW